MCKISNPNLCAYEAQALKELGETQTVHVPKVIFANDDFLVMEDLGTESKEIADADWHAFGAEFGRLHQMHSGTFGYKHDNYIGIWTQINAPENNWIDFFYKNRVSCFFDTGKNKDILTSSDHDGILNVIQKMKDLIPDQKPSLCHGDFWIDNIFRKKNGRVYVIDPAIHFGLPEADLAMTQMYGIFPDSFYEGYNETQPLAPGWKDRLPLYQIKELLLMIAQFEHAESIKTLRELIQKFR